MLAPDPLHSGKPASQDDTPGAPLPAPSAVITGGVRPLLRTNTAQPLRYHPVNGDFVIRDGKEFFNRPIYGAISDFRIDAGDLPEFSLYLPGHGGNLKFGFIGGLNSKWAAEADEVIARYRPGSMLYEIRDKLLGGGVLHLELLTPARGNGLLLQIRSQDISAGVYLAWAFAGASGRKGRRNGDIGCEVEPVSQFFQVRAEECAGNVFTFQPNTTHLKSDACELIFSLPAGATQAINNFEDWGRAPVARTIAAAMELDTIIGDAPILTGTVRLSTAPLYLTVQQIKSPSDKPWTQPVSEAFAHRSAEIAAVAAAFLIATPDPYIDAAAPALSVVGDALWDAKQECVMHGCVAWRVALAGWRGPYVLDALGMHDRAQMHFRHWLRRQNTSPVTGPEPALGPPDPDMHQARKEGMLHTNGDLSNNHYDMNLVFFDVLLRHLRWTGDLAFAREIWPAFQRHLAWEHRLFRRTFIAEDGRTLPLYEAYAAIWASDNLQYTGGGTAHASAYNIFSLRFAATLARLLGEDPTPYETEARLLERGMRELLWIPKQGAFAESKDLLGPQTVYTNPALWTVYHTLDSEVPTAREAWQMVAERLAVLKHIPVHGEGVPAGDWYMIACSDWLPYMWSLTLVLLSENMHMALGMWQAGMADEAFRVFKGSLLDSMYQGLCPGDIHMTSALDGHRQEAQRDFGDPAGTTSRALVEGLFGIVPDLIGSRGTPEIRIRPGFPSDWTHASLNHRDFDFAWKVEGATETLRFTSRFPKQVPLNLTLRARTTTLPTATVNGAPVPCRFDHDAVGVPTVILSVSAGTSAGIAIHWTGAAPHAIPAMQSLRAGAPLILPPGITLAQLDDPQSALSDGRATILGFHTVFARMHQGDAEWSMPISFNVTPPQPLFAAIPRASGTPDPLDLTPILKHNLADIFTRVYTDPRPPFCSLEIPDNLLGGWANLGVPAPVDDAGLRTAAGGILQTPIGVPFRTAAAGSPNALFLSWFKPDAQSISLSLSGRAHGLYVLVTGTTVPQCSRMQHALLAVHYTDGTAAKLSLRNPETWWPVEQDYMLDDYLFVDDAPLPPRVDLRTGQTRLLDPVTFRGKGRTVRGGAATVLHLPLDPTRTLSKLTLDVDLYGIVAALLAATLVRTWRGKPRGEVSLQLCSRIGGHRNLSFKHRNDLCHDLGPMMPLIRVSIGGMTCNVHEH